MNNMVDFILSNFTHVAPILALAVAAVVITLERVRALYLVYPLPGANEFYDRIRDLVLSNRVADAVALCDKYSSKPAAAIVREALLQAHQPEPLIEDSLQIAVSEATQRVQKRTGYLATIANVATLMGLLGTILGLVQSFGAVGSASAQQRSALLSAGISTAMNATLLGLFVAIPCMVLYAILASRTNRMTAEIHQAALRSFKTIRQRYFSVEEQPLAAVRPNSPPKMRVG